MKKELGKKQRKCCSGGRGEEKQRIKPFHPHLCCGERKAQRQLAQLAPEPLDKAIADTQNLLNNLKDLKKSMK